MMYDISDIKLLEITSEKLVRQLRRIVDEKVELSEDGAANKSILVTTFFISTKFNTLNFLAASLGAFSIHSHSKLNCSLISSTLLLLRSFTGEKVNDGIPMITYIAMGMAEEVDRAPRLV